MIKKCYRCGANMGGTGDVGDLCFSCQIMESRTFVTKDEFDRVKFERDYLQEQLDKILKELISLPPQERYYCMGCSLPGKVKTLEKDLEMFEEISKQHKSMNNKLVEIGYLYTWCMTGHIGPDYEGFAKAVKEIIGKENDDV